MTKVFDRLSLPTEYHSINELKAGILALFTVCLSMFILSTVVISLDLFLLSKVILLGTIAYEFILIYLLKDYVNRFIKKIKSSKAKSALRIIASLIFGALILLTVFTLLYTMTTENPKTENKFISLTIGLIIIVLPTIFWNEIVKKFEKTFVKYLKLFLISALLLTIPLGIVNAAPNTTTNQTQTNATSPANWWTSLTSGLTALQQVSSFFGQVQSFFTTFQSTISSVLGLSPFYSQVVVIVIILIGAFVLLKFLSTIVKWVVIILIVWIIIQLLI